MPKSISYQKYMCIGTKVTGSNNYQTPGKIYTVKIEKDESISEEILITKSFIGDDNTEYLFFNYDTDFTPIEEWRQKQLYNIGI